MLCKRKGVHIVEVEIYADYVHIFCKYCREKRKEDSDVVAGESFNGVPDSSTENEPL